MTDKEACEDLQRRILTYAAALINTGRTLVDQREQTPDHDMKTVIAGQINGVYIAYEMLKKVFPITEIHEDDEEPAPTQTGGEA